MTSILDTLPDGIDPQALKIPTKDLSREQWLAIRQLGIGSSDAAACLGLNKFKTRFALYMEKIGAWPQEDLSDVQSVQVGNDLEDYCAQKFTERTGRRVRRDNFIRRSAENPFMLANLDRRAVADVGAPNIVECKTSLGRWALDSDEWGEDGSDEIPDAYTIQVTHQMIVDESSPAFVPALLAKPRFCVYVVAFNVKLGNSIIEAEHEMWERILKREPPAVTSLADAQRMFPTARAIEIQATADMEQAVLDLVAVKKDAKSLKKTEDELKGVIAGFMGDADTLVSGRRRLLTYKTITKKEYVAQATSFRQFQIDKEISK